MEPSCTVFWNLMMDEPQMVQEETVFSCGKLAFVFNAGSIIFLQSLSISFMNCILSHVLHF